MGAHRYSVYGVTLSSEIALPLPSAGDGALAHVQLARASADYFAAAVGPGRFDLEWAGWFQYLPLPDGRSYVRGREMGEVLISADGRHILCCPESSVPTESFYVYLLGQALSFALLMLGFEPLHATAIEVDGQAVALLAESGNGKSTLAAAFVAAGYSVLTDDVLMVHPSGRNFLAYPGPPRLKLFPKVAARLMGQVRDAAPMNRDTTKLVVPLDSGQTCGTAVPLAAIYELQPPRGTPGAQEVTIEPVAGRDAALALVQAAFNQRLVTRDRLTRQFSAAVGLAERVPVRRLAYPRLVSRLPEVVAAVLADVARVAVRQDVCIP